MCSVYDFQKYLQSMPHGKYKIYGSNEKHILVPWDIGTRYQNKDTESTQMILKKNN